jgi:hypothetical protein
VVVEIKPYLFGDASYASQHYLNLRIFKPVDGNLDKTLFD